MCPIVSGTGSPGLSWIKGPQNGRCCYLKSPLIILTHLTTYLTQIQSNIFAALYVHQVKVSPSKHVVHFLLLPPPARIIAIRMKMLTVSK